MWPSAEVLRRAGATLAVVALASGLIGCNTSKTSTSNQPGATGGATEQAPKRGGSVRDARFDTLTGRLMDCYGDPTGWSCEPYGLRQGDNPSVPIKPIVACLSGGCSLVSADPAVNMTGYGNIEIRGRP